MNYRECFASGNFGLFGLFILDFQSSHISCTPAPAPALDPDPDPDLDPDRDLQFPLGPFFRRTNSLVSEDKLVQLGIQLPNSQRNVVATCGEQTL